VKYRAIILPQARADEDETFDFLAAQSLAVAVRFLDSVDASIRKLCDDPSPGMPCIFEDPRLAGLRWAKVRGFPNHLIFFRTEAGSLIVMRVLHGARDLEGLLV
jgi:toxin ParE1/3/4